MLAQFSIPKYALHSKWIALVYLILLLGLSYPGISFAQEQTIGVSTQYSQALIENLVQLYQSNEDRSLQVSIPTDAGDVAATLKPKRGLLRSRRAQVSLPGATAQADKEQVYTFAGTLGSTDPKDFITLTISRNAGGSFWLSGLMRKNGEFRSIELSRAAQEDASSTDEPANQSSGVEVTISQALPQSPLPDLLDSDMLLAPESSAASFEVAPAFALAAASAMRELEIATEADASYVAALGDSVSANTRITSILNAVDSVYQSQFGLALRITFQHTWTSAQIANYPYSSTNGSSLLSSFRDYWGANFASERYDVAHLFTGQTHASGTLGVAYLYGACNPSGRYGLSFRYIQDSNSFAVPIAAHEIAHNLGAKHVSSKPPTLMSPSLTPDLTNFSLLSLNQISTFLTDPRSSCISTVGGVPIDPPVIIQQPQDQVVIKRQNASFSVEADGTQPMLYQWFRGKRKIKGAYGPALTFKAIRSSKGNPYSVQISNAAGTLTSTAANLLVGVPPSIMAGDISKSLVAGKTVRIAFRKLKGTKPLTFTWYKNGVVMPSELKSYLKFPAGLVNNGDYYQLEISNSWGNIQSGRFNLSVSGP